MGHRGRPQKYASGSTRWSGNLPTNVVNALRAMPNASEWVSMVLSTALKTRSTDLTLAEIRQVNAEMLETERQLLLMKRRKATLEESLGAQQAVRDNHQDARHDLLERVLTGKRNGKDVYCLSWYESRSDVLQECGFDSAEDAVSWQDEQLRKWREANR